MADDRRVLDELFRTSPRGVAHVVQHYLYLRTEREASSVAAALRGDGYTTEERLGADLVNWLVLATHTVIPTEEGIATIRESMEKLAEKFGGEYDGWEAEVKPQ